jgi:hypothetical protein
MDSRLANVSCFALALVLWFGDSLITERNEKDEKDEKEFVSHGVIIGVKL